jgi:diaminopimelate epimerase
MRIPFTKAHGALNDFLLTWRSDAPEGDHAEIAKAICHRHSGPGADGWMLVDPPTDADADGAIQLYNSDGSHAEISGNGTRCAAALLVKHGHAAGVVRIRTGAGLKHLRLLRRKDLAFWFEMNMGRPEITGRFVDYDATTLWVGNPQCAVPVENFDFDWRGIGKEIERHQYFPHRTNVSFIRRVDDHTIDVRFWERGAGETMSSGTGSTGAASAAISWGWVTPPVHVQTPAGLIEIREEGDLYLTGPAQIVCEGVFFL